MVLRYATQDEVHRWDEQIHDNFLQSHTFAQVKQPEWKPLYLLGPDGVAILVMTRKVPFIGTIAYVPAGPFARDSDELKTTLSSLEAFLKEHRPDIFAVKVEPRTVKDVILSDNYVNASPIQPNATMILPITNELSSLGKRARRYIRTGEREGIKIESVELSDKNMDSMYALMSSANGGRGIPGLRQKPYYENFWKTFAGANQGALYFAYDDGTPVAGVYVVKIGKVALYKDGGSLHGRKSKGATYLIHWCIMQDLLDDGFTQYDLWGSPPSDRLDDVSHPLHGLASFKTAFTDKVVDYPGVYDIVLSPTKYAMWRKFYVFFRRYLLTVKKEGFY